MDTQTCTLIYNNQYLLQSQASILIKNGNMIGDFNEVNNCNVSDFNVGKL